MHKFLITFLLTGIVAFGEASEPESVRLKLVEAILTEDSARQIESVKNFVHFDDPLVRQTLEAWRGGVVYLLETNELKIPILLEAQTDSEGRTTALRISNGSRMLNEKGEPLHFSSTDLTAAETSSQLRKAIKTILDFFALANPNPKMRRDAATKLGQEQKLEYIPYFKTRYDSERSPEVKKAIMEAVAITELNSTDAPIRLAAINTIERIRSINALTFLQKMQGEVPGRSQYDPGTMNALRKSVRTIETYMWWGNFFGTAFRGFSLAAVLLVAALGLAITFGLMGVINMAHGEIIMIGAYTTYVTQNIFQALAATRPALLEYYFVFALPFSFLVAALVGLILERAVIRFLYKRPLESLLATWGVSLVLQQLFRQIFGAANVQVSSPGWLSGSYVINDVLLAYNRVFVIGFAFFVVFLTYWLLTRTSLGLQIRAVMQNRSMASALGVRTDRVNLMTFAFGSGLAGMAGACLSQIGNVGPSLGQNYIIDCFMVVVLGGVGNLVGTVSASLGIGVTDQILQPWLGAVLGKITVLAAIILFLQWRPAGLFVTRTRSLEG